LGLSLDSYDALESRDFATLIQVFNEREARKQAAANAQTEALMGLMDAHFALLRRDFSLANFKGAEKNIEKYLLIKPKGAPQKKGWSDKQIDAWIASVHRVAEKRKKGKIQNGKNKNSYAKL